jgi:hypothetical protein
MAEVKVKITAANQTQTGFQSVLADAKKTATQVQQTFSQASAGPRMPKLKEMTSAGPMDIDIGDYGLGPLRELQDELKKARQSAQQAFDTTPPEEFSNGIGSVLGRFALMIGAAATVGKIVASAFDSLSEAVKRAIGVQEQFNRSLREAGSATSLEGAITQFKQLQDFAQQTGKTIEQTFGRSTGEALANLFSGRPGQLLARGADMLTGGSVADEIRAQQQQQRRIAGESLLASLSRQSLEAQAVAQAGGDEGAIDQAQKEQRRRAAKQQLEAALTGVNPVMADLIRQEQAAIDAAQDQAEANKQKLETEKEITREKERQAQADARAAERRRDFNANTELLQARASGDKGLERDLLERQDFERALEATGSFEDAANFAAASQALRDQKENKEGGIAGSFGASQLQRIGFASNEFFDTRRKEDPAKTMQQVVRELQKVNKNLENGEPIVLRNNG